MCRFTRLTRQHCQQQVTRRDAVAALKGGTLHLLEGADARFGLGHLAASLRNQPSNKDAFGRVRSGYREATMATKRSRGERGKLSPQNADGNKGPSNLEKGSRNLKAA
jgi:hypothetical protein